MRQRWRQVHVAGLVSAAMLSGGFAWTIQWQHLQKLSIWRKLVDIGKGETMFCDSVLPSENVFRVTSVNVLVLKTMNNVHLAWLI